MALDIDDLKKELSERLGYSEKRCKEVPKYYFDYVRRKMSCDYPIRVSLPRLGIMKVNEYYLNKLAEQIEKNNDDEKLERFKKFFRESFQELERRKSKYTDSMP